MVPSSLRFWTTSSMIPCTSALPSSFSEKAFQLRMLRSGMLHRSSLVRAFSMRMDAVASERTDSRAAPSAPVCCTTNRSAPSRTSLSRGIPAYSIVLAFLGAMVPPRRRPAGPGAPPPPTPTPTPPSPPPSSPPTGCGRPGGDSRRGRAGGVRARRGPQAGDGQV